MTGFLLLFLLGLSGQSHASGPVAVGSKAFTEGFILAELCAQKIAEVAPVTRHYGLGGTGLLFQALENGEIQLYPEYTGTLAEAILHRPDLRDDRQLRAELARKGFVLSQPLGFSNTYALALSESFAASHHIRSLSDLARFRGHLRYAISHEFLERSDGFRALARAYGLSDTAKVQAMDHGLAYEAIRSGQADVIDVYSTDAKIEKFRLAVLEDDRAFFPRYEAVIVARETFPAEEPAAWAAVQSLAGTVSEKTMRELNARVELDDADFHDVVSEYLDPSFRASTSGVLERAQIPSRAREHLILVSIALVFSFLVGIPLGIWAARARGPRQLILLLSGLLQTIPSLALLCFLLPLFGIGRGTAVVALCLYGLLPVVMGTVTGLQEIDPVLIEVARAFRLSPWVILLRVEIPLASRAILGGIRTSAIIGIGTATLAALIGAGGFGATIMEGLALNDLQLVFWGALPAACFALVAHAVFEVLNFCLIPKPLRR